MDTRQKRTESEWSLLLRRFERSGQSQRDFCAAEGISRSSFRFWRDRLRGTAVENEFMEVVEVALPRESYFELEREGVLVRVPQQFNASALKALLEVL